MLIGQATIVRLIIRLCLNTSKQTGHHPDGKDELSRYRMIRLFSVFIHRRIIRRTIVASQLVYIFSNRTISLAIFSSSN